MRTVFTTLILVALSSLGISSYFKHNSQADSQPSTTKETIQPISSTGKTSALSNLSNENQSAPKSTIDPQQADLDINDYFFENSVFDEENKNKDYENYSDETLESLADNGDVFAMKTLAMRLLKRQIELGVDAPNYSAINEKYMHYVKLAVLHGDGEMITLLPEAIQIIPPSSEGLEIRNKAFIDHLAFAEFYGLRGRLEDKYMKQRKLLMYFYPERTEVTTEEVAQIKQKGKEIYDKYERERIELGLGPFDNSISEGMQAYFEEARRNHIEQIGDLAFD